MNELPHLPTEEEIDSAKAYSQVLARFSGKRRVHVRLSAEGQAEPREDLVLPGHLVDLMLQVVTEVAKGNGVSVLPIHAELTTQQAANLLNVSRPHLVSLLEGDEIPFHKVGSHRRIRAQDLMAYKARHDAHREEALDEMTRLSQEMGLYDDAQNS